ncbi:MAG: TIGR03621 family F420-dependent LLM class oxidoreductase [Chloroflexota bacterium]
MDAGKRRFRFAITGGAPTLAGLRDFARKAEDLGFSSLVIPDHFGPQMAPLPALIAAAAATTRLRVGTLVFDNDFRNPALLAKEAATADIVTGGRFELGIGAGWMMSDYEATGIPFEPAGVRVSKLEESLHILKAFFAEETVNFDGTYYHLHGLAAAPKPVQQPRPPILMGATGPRMLALAGREADIISIEGKPDPPRNLWGASTAERFMEQLEVVKRAAGSRYHEIEISTLSDIQLGDTTDALARQFDLDRATVLGMPAVFTGEPNAVIDQMLERRERYDISYHVVVSRNMDAVAPIVARLAGK